MALLLTDKYWLRLVAFDVKVDQSAVAGEGNPKIALGDREADRVNPAAVNDARYDTFATEATRGA
jgi:hypothetical protein